MKVPEVFLKQLFKNLVFLYSYECVEPDINLPKTKNIALDN